LKKNKAVLISINKSYSIISYESIVKFTILQFDKKRKKINIFLNNTLIRKKKKKLIYNNVLIEGICFYDKSEVKNVKNIEQSDAHRERR